MIIFNSKLIIKKKKNCPLVSLLMHSSNGPTTEHWTHTFVSVMNIFKLGLTYCYVICFYADEDLCQSTSANKCCIIF